LRESEKRVLRIKFGCKREEVVGCWRRLHNAELHYCMVYQILLGSSNKEAEMEAM
jgi:hypothetical protein